MKLEVHPDAENDLADGWEFYEGMCPGLGDEFLDHLEGEMRQLLNTFARHPRVHGVHHRAVVQKRFPYAIYYTFDEDHIFIKMVFDCRRDPDLIPPRLGSA
jgi:hypothetical protein